MRKLFILLFLGVLALFANAWNAPPVIDDDGLVVQVVQQDGTLVSADLQIREWEVPGNFTDLVISIDDLKEENRLYASLSCFPQDGVAVEEDISSEVENSEADSGSNILDFLISYWAVLIIAFMAFLKVIVNLTPSAKDNQVFSWLDSLFNAFVPNYKSGGGTHDSDSS